jgi:hypothetical protein
MALVIGSAVGSGTPLFHALPDRIPCGGRGYRREVHRDRSRSRWQRSGPGVWCTIAVVDQPPPVDVPGVLRFCIALYAHGNVCDEFVENLCPGCFTREGGAAPGLQVPCPRVRAHTASSHAMASGAAGRSGESGASS